jgi:hypothetical protein
MRFGDGSTLPSEIATRSQRAAASLTQNHISLTRSFIEQAKSEFEACQLKKAKSSVATAESGYYSARKLVRLVHSSDREELGRQIDQLGEALNDAKRRMPT